jgi:hypothetical protein
MHLILTSELAEDLVFFQRFERDPECKLCAPALTFLSHTPLHMIYADPDLYIVCGPVFGTNYIDPGSFLSWFLPWSYRIVCWQITPDVLGRRSILALALLWSLILTPKGYVFQIHGLQALIRFLLAQPCLGGSAIVYGALIHNTQQGHGASSPASSIDKATLWVNLVYMEDSPPPHSQPSTSRKKESISPRRSAGVNGLLASKSVLSVSTGGDKTRSRLHLPWPNSAYGSEKAVHTKTIVVRH